jgi:hypothetical protein
MCLISVYVTVKVVEIDMNSKEKTEDEEVMTVEGIIDMMKDLMFKVRGWSLLYHQKRLENAWRLVDRMCRDKIVEWYYTGEGTLDLREEKSRIMPHIYAMLIDFSQMIVI